MTTGYTRAQLAAAIDEVHGLLHEAEGARFDGVFLREKLTAIHEALHRVGAGQERTGCGTPDPEVQQVVGAWIEKLEGTGLPCGHRLADLIGGPGAITKCGACLAARQKDVRGDEDKIRAILADVAFPGYQLHVGQVTGTYLQVRYEEPDVDTGQMAAQHGRKWYISSHATRGEIVQTALKAILTSAEHRAREHFTYRGARLFGPHFDVEKLADLASGDGALDVRMVPDPRPSEIRRTR